MFRWLKSERFWRFAVASFFFLGFLGGVFIGSLLIFPPASGTFKFQQATKTQELKSRHDAIAAGPLALKGTGASRFLPHVLNELQLLGVNTRPDHADQNKLYLVHKGTGEERRVETGKPFFLQVEETGEGSLKITGFSAQPDGLKVTPLSADMGNVRFEVGMPGEKSGLVNIKPAATPLSAEPYCWQLKEAHWWGQDALIRHYGCSEYEQRKNRQKIELGGENSGICFVTVGDRLVWDQGRWQKAASENLLQSSPLAEVTEVSGHRMEIRIWDESGFRSDTVRLTPQMPSKRPLNLDCLPTSIRLRSDASISCLFGKKRLLLKEGDWVLRTPHGWRLLKKANEIDDYLSHRLRGELFIFDKLEKAHGKVILRGHYFDAMRTQMQKVIVPVTTERHPTKKRQK